MIPPIRATTYEDYDFPDQSVKKSSSTTRTNSKFSSLRRYKGRNQVIDRSGNAEETGASRVNEEIIEGRNWMFHDCQRHCLTMSSLNRIIDFGRKRTMQDGDEGQLS